MSEDGQIWSELAKINELDRVVHEPARLLILALLHVVQFADFLYLERQTGMTRGNMASHIKKLEAAGFVEVEKKFVDKIPRTLYRLTPRGRTAFREYREQLTGALSTVPSGPLPRR